jgi:hypothetical protein
MDPSLTGEQHLAPSTIRNYQTDLRPFSEYLVGEVEDTSGVRTLRRRGQTPDRRIGRGISDSSDIRRCRSTPT